MEAKAIRTVNIVYTEDSLDLKGAAQILAHIITNGDSNTYINKIIENRRNKKLIVGDI